MTYLTQNVPLITVGSSFTRPANTSAYAVGGLVANSTTAGSVIPSTIAAARGINTPSTILRCRLQKSGVTASGAGSLSFAIFRLHLYNQMPTIANGDGAQWLTTLAGYIGSLDVTVNEVGSDVSQGTGVPVNGSTIAFTPVTGTANIYCLIEARAAYVPASGEVFTPVLEIQ